MIPDELKSKKIVYMGTPDFAVPALSALLREGYDVAGVVTQPDKPKGRSKKMVPSPVKEEAEKHGIPVWQPARVRDPEFIRFLTEQKPDMIIVAAFGQIIPKAVLDLPPYGCINIHGSLLPKYRGAAPIQRAVLDGEKESGVTIMRMDEGIDTGDIISKRVVTLSEDETGGSLFDRLSVLGADLLIDTLPLLFSGEAHYEKQPAESPTPYASMLKKESGHMDFNNEAGALERQVRGLSPWPGAYTSLDGKTFKIWRSAVLPAPEGDFSPGTVINTGSEGILVKCAQDALLLQEVQLEGKKRMAADAFLRGYHLEPGTILH